MTKQSRSFVYGALVLLLVLAAGAAMAQQGTTQNTSAEVLRVLQGGRTVILRMEPSKEIRKYSEIPEGVKLYVEGKEAKISDLREGMHLTAFRIENTPPPVVMTEAEVAALPASAAASPAAMPPPAPAAATTSSTASAPAAEPAAAELPSTASANPTVLLVGLSLLAVGLAAGALRRRTA